MNVITKKKRDMLDKKRKYASRKSIVWRRAGNLLLTPLNIVATSLSI